MREQTRKAKRIDNGEWIEGYYVFRDKEAGDKATHHYILVHDEYGFDWVEIDANTLCEPTGLTDKNGNKIWENDVVFVTDDDGNSGQVDTGIGEIDFFEGLWYINGRVQNSLYDINRCFQIEVIGNVFDNPELVKGSEE